MSSNELSNTHMSLISRNLSVFDVLQNKMSEITKGNKPIGMFTDFVASEFDMIEQKKKQLKEYRDLITMQLKDLEQYEKECKEDIATYLQSNGIDKLEGIITSSMTINKGSKPQEEIKTKLVRLPIYSKADEEEALINSGICEYQDEIVAKEGKNPCVKINKKRA